MGEGLSHWSNMVLRKSQTYFFDRHTHPNSMYSNFCHVLKEFSKNYYLNNHGKCAYDEDDRFCILVKWDDFKCNPNAYIEQAFNKRNHPIASEVIVRPK